MSARCRAISLAAALMLGVGALGMSTGSAHALPRHPKDAGVRCVMYGTEADPGEDATFYLPGDIHLSRNSTWAWRCESDGTWRLIDG